MARILVVDDDPSTLEVISKYLAKCGHIVESASQWPQRDRAHSIQAPRALIILDLCMPHFDGCSLLEVVRSYVRLKELPVIVLTGLSDGPLIQRPAISKVNTILTKGSTRQWKKSKKAVQLELRTAPRINAPIRSPFSPVARDQSPRSQILLSIRSCLED